MSIIPEKEKEFINKNYGNNINGVKSFILYK